MYTMNVVVTVLVANFVVNLNFVHLSKRLSQLQQVYIAPVPIKIIQSYNYKINNHTYYSLL